MTAEIAPQTDRLVWAVADRIRAQKANEELPGLQALSPMAVSRTINLVQFTSPDIGEDFIRRRYVYASDEQITTYLDEMVRLGLFETAGGRLRPTDSLPPILEAFDRAIESSAQLHWQAHADVVDSVLPLARHVLEACPKPEMLVSAALTGPEADDDCQRLYQRLAALRLMRNEAHVRAWKARGLVPNEVEILTSAWAGSKIQSSAEPTESMIERGLVADGVVTDAGLDVRREIEDETNAGVAEAFAAVDQAALLAGLRQLPGPLD